MSESYFVIEARITSALAVLHQQKAPRFAKTAQDFNVPAERLRIFTMDAFLDQIERVAIQSLLTSRKLVYVTIFIT